MQGRVTWTLLSAFTPQTIAQHMTAWDNLGYKMGLLVMKGQKVEAVVYAGLTEPATLEANTSLRRRPGRGPRHARRLRVARLLRQGPAQVHLHRAQHHRLRGDPAHHPRGQGAPARARRLAPSPGHLHHRLHGRPLGDPGRLTPSPLRGEGRVRGGSGLAGERPLQLGEMHLIVLRQAMDDVPHGDDAADRMVRPPLPLLRRQLAPGRPASRPAPRGRWPGPRARSFR